MKERTMSITDIQKQTNANIQAKANLIWEIATHLVGLFKPHEYGKVILPMTVLKRFDDALAPTKADVVAMAEKLKASGIEGQVRDGILCTTSKYAFYNTSKFDFAKPGIIGVAVYIDASKLIKLCYGIIHNVKNSGLIALI